MCPLENLLAAFSVVMEYFLYGFLVRTVYSEGLLARSESGSF